MYAEKKLMTVAIELARQCAKDGDYALAAVVVKTTNCWVGTTRLKHDNDPTVHAEIVADCDACQKLNSRFLIDSLFILLMSHAPCVRRRLFGPACKVLFLAQHFKML